MTARLLDISKLIVAGVRGLTPYEPGKPVEELERELGVSNAIKLASNENPLGCSSAVHKVLACDALHRYPDGSAFRLKLALADFLQIGSDRLTIGNGSNDLLDLLARLFAGPGRSAVVAEHCFVVYPIAVRAAGAELKMVPARDYGHDLQAMVAAVTGNTRLLFIANPNNPTGTWHSHLAIEKLLKALPREVIVVLDEAYGEYMAGTDYPSSLELLERYENLVVTRTFSKIYGLASLRVGYAISSPAIADYLNRIRAPFNVNSPGLRAAEAALGDQAFVAKSHALNLAGLQQLQAGCKKLSLDYIPGGGNFLTIDLGRPAGPVYASLLRAGVIVRPLAGYGLPRHLRVTVGLETENSRFLSCLARVLRVP